MILACLISFSLVFVRQDVSSGRPAAGMSSAGTPATQRMQLRKQGIGFVLKGAVVSFLQPVLLSCGSS